MRKQSGHVYSRGGWWQIRHWDNVLVNNQVVRKQLNHRLEPVKPEHARLKRPPAEVVSRAEDWLREKVTKRPATTLATIGGFVDTVYLKFVKEQKRPSTFKGYKNMWGQYWLPRCGNVLMRDVRTCDVDSWLESIAKDSVAEDRPLSRATLKHLKSLMSGIFKHAKRKGFFDGINPVMDTGIPQTAESGDTHAYSLEEITGMLMIMPEPARTIVATAAYTGARRGELRGMRWENLHDGAIYVEGSVWQSHELEPKTRASKAPIPIIPALASMLARHRERIGSPSSGPLFPSGSGKPICLNNVANRMIMPALNRCATCRKPEAAHQRSDHPFKRDDRLPKWQGWHAFRRGLATNLYRLGVPDKVIQGILRHSDLRTTMNIYVKTVNEDAVNAMLALDSSPLCTDCAPEGPQDDGARVN